VKTTKLFGIPNCDSVRKARRWLDERGIAYVFHDFRKDGLDAQRLSAWIGQAGWEPLLNRKGTTWRQLPAEQREEIDARRAQTLMLAQPALIKRPVLESGQHLEVGFSADRYSNLFKGSQ
jgi:arsenate reductase (glutaredoxin)